MQNIISEGKHLLTCVEDVRFAKWGDELDCLYIILDGKAYLAYRDTYDGYRSYGVFVEVGDENILTNIINKFPQQEVYFTETQEKTIDDELDYIVSDVLKQEFRNADGELILGVYTDYAEDYYPVGWVEYIPKIYLQTKLEKLQLGTQQYRK